MKDVVQEFKVELKFEIFNELDFMMKHIKDKIEFLEQDIASKCLSHDVKQHVSRELEKLDAAIAQNFWEYSEWSSRITSGWLTYELCKQTKKFITDGILDKPSLKTKSDQNQ